MRRGDFAGRGFVEVALIKADLPKVGFAGKSYPAQRDRFCRESPIRSGKSSFVIEG